MYKIFTIFLLLLVGGIYPLEGVAATPQLHIRSNLVLPSIEMNGVKLAELSGLAWDNDEQLLYAVSDKGNIFHLRLKISGNQLEAAELVFAAHLLDSKGVRVASYRADAEGLMVINANNGRKGDTQLVIALEGEPRLIRFTPDGRAIKNITPPRPLQERRSLRHPNLGLESVTFHPRFGFITAPEMPLRGEPANLHTIYSTKGQHWSFMAYPAENSGISALETLPDGNLLILERAWSGLLSPMTISLRYLDFKQCSRDGACTVQNLRVLSSHLVVDNYEGLTHIQGNQYLMVSDDGSSNWLTTKLTLFTLDLPGK